MMFFIKNLFLLFFINIFLLIFTLYGKLFLDWVHILTIQVSNSTKNSALIVYKINITIDHYEKNIYISAIQSIILNRCHFF
jgi:hypothetical protein